MRIAAFVVLALLGACGGTEGLQIVIEPPPAGETQPDRVRLYIGVPTEAEGAITPPALDTRYGNFWMRDDKNVDDVVEITPPNAATFVFEDDLGLGEYGSVIAVGLTRDPSGQETITSTATLFHVRMGVGEVHVYRAQLTPSVPADVNLDAPVQHTVWGGDGGDACIHVVNRASTDMMHHHRTASIVSRGDRDCDGFPDDAPLECENTAYLGTRVPDHEDDLSCLAVASSSDECTLGALPCVDGEGEIPGTCAPSPYCTPQTLCRECATRSDPWACARDSVRFGATGGLPFLVCKVYAYAVSDMPLRHQICSMPRDFIPPPLLALPSTVECEEAIVTWPDADGFDSSYNAEGISIDFDTTPTCGLIVRPSGTYEGALPITRAGLLGARLTNGRGWAIPLRIDVIPMEDTLGEIDCPNYRVQCTLEGSITPDASAMRACMDLPAMNTP